MNFFYINHSANDNENNFSRSDKTEKKIKYKKYADKKKRIFMKSFILI